MPSTASLSKSARPGDEGERAWLDSVAFLLQYTVECLEGALWYEKDECMKRIKSYYPVQVPIDGDIITLHIKKMSPDQIAEFEETMDRFGFHLDGRRPEILAANRPELMRWVASVFKEYIGVPAGQLEVEDESGEAHALTTGEELLAQYSGRADVFPIILSYVYGEHRVSEELKARYRERVQEFVLRHVGSGAALEDTPASPDPVVAH
jgi:hypothetical protein